MNKYSCKFKRKSGRCNFVSHMFNQAKSKIQITLINMLCLLSTAGFIRQCTC